MNRKASPSSAPSQPVPPVSRAKQEAKSAAEDLKQGTAEVAEAAGDEARHAAETVRGHAQDVAKDIGSKAKQVAETYSDVASRQLAGIAKALLTAADTLGEQEQSVLASQTTQVAEGLDEMAKRLGDNDVDSLMSMSKDWARDNAGAFLGGSVAVGFALSRFLTASPSDGGSSREDGGEPSATKVTQVHAPPASETPMIDPLPHPRDDA